MYIVGQKLKGWKFNSKGVEELLEGTFIARTDDPEELYQDIIMDVDGVPTYFDERDVREAA